MRKTGYEQGHMQKNSSVVTLNHAKFEKLQIGLNSMNKIVNPQNH